MPPDKQPAAETLEEIADRLAKQITDNPCSYPSCCPRTAKVAVDILSVLRNERERCAKLAELMATGETYSTGRQKAINIAAAIREGQ